MNASFEKHLAYAIGLCRRRAGTNNNASTRELCNCVENNDGERLLAEIVRQAHKSSIVEQGARLLFNLSSLNDAADRFGVPRLCEVSAQHVSGIATDQRTQRAVAEGC